MLIFKPKVIPNVDLIELENVCRICLYSSGNMISLFHNEIDSLISEFLPQKLHRKPSQPYQICAKCLEEARTAYRFKKQCQYADELIKSMLNEPNISKTHYEKQTQTDISLFIYSCEKCEKKFESSKILRKHSLNEHRNTPNICRICGKVFSRGFTLRDHLISVHSELGFLILNNHKCYLCEKNFTTKSRLKTHLFNIHNVNEYFETQDEINCAIEEDSIFVTNDKNEFSCENCLENFQVEDDLKNHECTSFLYKKVLERNSSNWLQLINDCDKNKIKVVPVSEENNECDLVFVDNLKTEYECEENTVEKNGNQIFFPGIEINTDKLFVEELKVSREEEETKETNTNANLKRFDCIMPSKSLTKDHLRRHVKSIRNGLTTTDKKICKQKLDLKYRMSRKITCSTEKKTRKKKLFSCKICMKKFISKRGVRRHITVTHNGTKEYSCEYCLETIIGEIEFKKHCKGQCTEIVHTKGHLCSECGKGFKYLHELKRHIRKHTGEKPYKCEYCNRAFSLPGNLHRHKKIHTGERSYHCTYCSKAFIQSTSFKTHMRNHTGERPFKCSHCSKTFKDNPTLKEHSRRHSGERSYCDLCNLSYSTPIILLNHKRRAHGIDKTKEFSCKICSEKIIGVIDYQKHCKVHQIPKEKSHICFECGIGFKDSNSLKMHMRKHTGEKPFKCEYCDRAFSGSSNLKRHIKIHTGEKNFRCKDCPKAFTDSTSLKYHLKTHTGERPYKCSYCEMAFRENRCLQKHLVKHNSDVILL